MMMASKTELRRELLRQSLIEIAERRIAADGYGALTARDVAGEAGCAVGAIYNIFRDMDALVTAVNARTLGALEDAVARAFSDEAVRQDPKRALVTLGLTYFEFVAAHPRLWSAIFELGFRAGKELPQWQIDEHIRLIGHIVKPLRALLPGEPEQRLDLLGRSLFSAVHGIVSLGLARRFMAVPPAEIAAQITFIVEAFCDGVVARRKLRPVDEK
jgi:AcrR family transcriptional regulator